MDIKKLIEKAKKEDGKKYDKYKSKSEAFRQALKDKGEGEVFMYQGAPILLKTAKGKKENKKRNETMKEFLERIEKDLKFNDKPKTDSEYRDEIKSFVRNFNQKYGTNIDVPRVMNEEGELVAAPRTEHRHEGEGGRTTVNHVDYGGTDFDLTNVSEEMGKKFLKEMAQAGFRTIDERKAYSKKRGTNTRGIGHVDANTTDRNKGNTRTGPRGQTFRERGRGERGKLYQDGKVEDLVFFNEMLPEQKEKDYLEKLFKKRKDFKDYKNDSPNEGLSYSELFEKKMKELGEGKVFDYYNPDTGKIEKHLLKRAKPKAEPKPEPVKETPKSFADMLKPYAEKPIDEIKSTPSEEPELVSPEDMNYMPEEEMEQEDMSDFDPRDLELQRLIEKGESLKSLREDTFEGGGIKSEDSSDFEKMLKQYANPEQYGPSDDELLNREEKEDEIQFDSDELSDAQMMDEAPKVENKVEENKALTEDISKKVENTKELTTPSMYTPDKNKVEKDEPSFFDKIGNFFKSGDEQEVKKAIQRPSTGNPQLDALLKEYDKSMEAYKEELDSARTKDMWMNLAQGLMDYASYNNAAVGARAGLGINPMKVDLKKDYASDVAKRRPDIKDTLQEAQLYGVTDKSKDNWKLTTLEDEDGNPVTYRINPNTGEKEKVGVRGYSNLVRDPLTGEVLTRSEYLRKNRGPSDEDKTFFQGLNPDQRKAFREVRKEFTAETKDKRAAMTDLDAALNTIKGAEDNEISASQLGVMVAKLFENNRLTDEDVVRYTKRNSVPSRIVDVMEQLKSGTITKGKAGEIREALKIFRDSTVDSLKGKLLEKSRLFSSDYGVDSEDVAKNLYPEYSNIKKEQEPTFPMYVRKDGKRATVTNKEQLDDARSKGWK